MDIKKKRPKAKDPKDYRNIQLNMRVNEKERQAFVDLANRQGVTLTELIFGRVFGKERP
jgi:predicted HicB family RNase H-like nuclease